MRKFRPTDDAIQLFLEGSLALSEVESHGCRIDKPYLERAITDVNSDVAAVESELRADPIYKTWQRRYPTPNLAAPEQLATVIFTDLGYKSKYATSSGKRASASKDALESVDLPFVKRYVHAQELRKAGDFLVGIQREMVQHDDGLWYVHPSYSLNKITFRSGCSQPNFQNQPNRIPKMAEIVRRCYIARDGYQLGECDLGQIEVRIPCAYSFDPVLIDYVSDSNKDMHRDTACDIFMLDAPRIHKLVRHCAKNKFVFPSFYGSYYAQMAPDIWDAIDQQNLTYRDGSKTIRQHLRECGIAELGACDPDQSPVPGTFEHHLKQIEDRFWNERFIVHTKWKKDWVAAYERDGGCQFLTGFIMTGPHKRNDIINYPVQGSAFHCCLWALIQINNILKKYKMKSRIIGEIHDCINFEIWPSERDDVFSLCEYIMTRKIREWATWLNVPITVECEICPVGGSWFDKMVVKCDGDTYRPVEPDKWNKQYGEWK